MEDEKRNGEAATATLARTFSEAVRLPREPAVGCGALVRPRSHSLLINPPERWLRQLAKISSQQSRRVFQGNQATQILG